MEVTKRKVWDRGGQHWCLADPTIRHSCRLGLVYDNHGLSLSWSMLLPIVSTTDTAATGTFLITYRDRHGNCLYTFAGFFQAIVFDFTTQGTQQDQAATYVVEMSLCPWVWLRKFRILLM